MYAMNVQVPREAEDTGSPGPGDISSCETPDIATGNKTWVLWENSEWNPLSNPSPPF